MNVWMKDGTGEVKLIKRRRREFFSCVLFFIRGLPENYEKFMDENSLTGIIVQFNFIIAVCAVNFQIVIGAV
jgi:hypothetical protein